VFVFSVVNNSPVSLGDYVYPDWACGIGWLMFAVAVAVIPLIAATQVVKVCLENQSSVPLVRHSSLNCVFLCVPLFLVFFSKILTFLRTVHPRSVIFLKLSL